MGDSMTDQHEATVVAAKNAPNLVFGRGSLVALETIDHSHTNIEESERHLADALQRSLHVEPISSTEQKRAADVVTPPTYELSPGLLSSLRGSSSPSYSQVSVGSIGPTPVLGLSRNTYELTPVTRNTSGEYHTTAAAPVTPGDFLHGEHLALPADLNEDTPSPPPLKMSVSSKHHSVIVARGLPPEGNAPPEAVQFPARKFYSFTTREQYEDTLACSMEPGETYDLSDDEDEDPDKALFVQPYAPRRRRDNFDIESLPDEELQQIFCTGSDESSTAQHRLSGAFPLEARIPSLRLANRLHGSITSFTSYNTDGTDNDEEDSLVHIHGDADDCESLNSSSHLQDFSHEDEDDPIRRKQRKRKQLLKEERAVEWLQSLDSSQVAEAASSKFLLQQPSVPRKQAFDLKRITSTPAGHS